MIENITRDDIDVHVKAENWEDAIKKSSEYLLKTGKITEGYIDSMIEAVHRVGPYIVLGHSVALAHVQNAASMNWRYILRLLIRRCLLAANSLIR